MIIPSLQSLEPRLQSAAGVLALLLAAYLVRLVVRMILMRVAAHIGATDQPRWIEVLLHPRVCKRLSQTVPSVVAQLGIPLIPHLPDTVSLVASNVAAALTVLHAVRVLNALLAAVLETHTAHNGETINTRSIKSYVQLGQLLIILGGAVIIVATLIDRSPLILLSGLGAMSAVLMLVFKDTILSFTAGLQLTTNDMLHVGDWIEMPQVGANGTVTDIALHTVKVQNWDNTFTTIPTWRLMSESFINWRGMTESGGRRIKRTLRIDAASIAFLDDTQIDRLAEVALLRDALARQQQALRQSNDELRQRLGALAAVPTNIRRLTNIGTFRAYAEAYLRASPHIRTDMLLMVRAMEPTAEGVPLEVYCFASATSLAPYEAIQADLFDHLMAVLPEFGLRLYQSPSGNDLRAGLRLASAPQ